MKETPTTKVIICLRFAVVKQNVRLSAFGRWFVRGFDMACLCVEF